MPHKMNYKRLLELYWEMDAFCKKMHGLYLDAVAGFYFVRQAVQIEQEKARRFLGDIEISTEQFQDTRIFSYDMIFANPICASAIHQATQGTVKERNAPNGENYILLGQMCIVSMADYWNEYLRPEWGIAKEILPQGFYDLKKEERNTLLTQHMSDDFWGDMNTLRNSIIHKQGIASSKVANCKIIKWFKPNDPIALSPEKMREIFLVLLRTRNQIHSDSLPRETFAIA